MRYNPEALDYESLFPSKRRTLNPEGERDLEEAKAPTLLKPDPSGDQRSSAKAKKDKTPSFLEVESGAWLDRRGHGLTFACLFVFSVVLYFRPYELIPALSSFKTMAFYVGITTLLVFAVSQLILEGNLTARPREVNMALLVALGALLSIPFAIDPAEAWKEFSELLIKTVLIFIVIVNVLRTERRLKIMFLLVLVVSIYLSINAISDYRAGIFKIGLEETNTLRVAGSIKGLFDNSNDLALHLVTITPIAIALGFEKRGVFRKVIYLSIALLMMGAIIITFSRGGFLALIAMVLVLTRKLARRNKSAAFATITLAVLLFLVAAPATYSGRLSTIFDSASDITGSSSQRTEVLKRSIVVALRYPLFGVGIGNFHHRSFQELGTHNAYTQVAAETGIAAMIAYIILLVHPLRKLRMIERELFERNESSRYYYLAIGLQASLVAYMVASFFAAVAYQWYIYYLVGYAIALRRIYYIQESRKSVIPPSPVPAHENL